jgi:RNA polymerase sigma-32 factor
MQHSSEPVWTYIEAVKRKPKLDRDEELALARRLKQTGDAAAGELLAAANLRHVVTIALSYRRYGVPLGELIAEGNFGLAYALGRFDPERGVRFMTYAAYWVRTYVVEHVIRSWSLVGAGSGPLRSKLFFKLRRERGRLQNLLGAGEATDAALAERLGMDRERLGAMLRRFDARDVSFDAEPDANGSRKAADVLVAEDNQEELLGQWELSERLGATVRRALGTLDARERYIVERRLMADEEEELSLAEIGKSLGVSRERARQLEERTKKKLRLAIGADAELDWERPVRRPVKEEACRLDTERSFSTTRSSGWTSRSASAG